MKRGLSLDAGALIGIERGDDFVRGLVDRVERSGRAVHVVPEVVAQVWRGGSRQARLAAFFSVRDVTIPGYDELTARAVGQLCGMSGHADVVDVHVALHARLHRHAVATSDPEDIARVDPSLELIVV